VGVIDIHTHVLHGLDDGARTVEESVAMLELAAADGTTDLVATPHANSRFPFRPDLVAERIAALEGRSPVRLHRGCDFRLQSDTIEDALRSPAKYAINGRTYLLVEFPDLSLFPNTDLVLAPLLDAGLVPIVTHPERHRDLQSRPDDLARWIGMGCAVQITAGSLTGAFGERPRAAAELFVARGLAHVVASDAHDIGRRPPRLSVAHALVADRWGEEAAQALFVDHPRAALTGEAFDTTAQPRAPRKRRWFSFLRG
jgi:protein-tyrosine phosphatase